MDMEDDNVEGIMEETASIVEKVEEMTATDVDYIADIMDKTVKILKITKEVGSHFSSENHLPIKRNRLKQNPLVFT